MIRILIETVAAYGVAVGFGILFNIKGKSLRVAGVGGSIGWFVYKITSIYMGLHLELHFLLLVYHLVYIVKYVREYI